MTRFWRADQEHWAILHRRISSSGHSYSGWSSPTRLGQSRGDGDQDSEGNSIRCVHAADPQAPCTSRAQSTKLPLVGHTNFSTAIATFTQSIAIKPLACSPKGGDGKISCETMPHRATLRLSRSALKFALPLSHPCSQRGFSRRFHSWPSTDGFMALIEDFRLESSSPEQKFVSQRPADADCFNLGPHKPRLTPAHDEKIARSTEQKYWTV